jgi:hypothetical protein
MTTTVPGLARDDVRDDQVWWVEASRPGSVLKESDAKRVGQKLEFHLHKLHR